MQIKLGRLGTVNFAKRPAPRVESEQGSVGDHKMGSLFNGEVINTQDIKIKDLVQMRKNDGTARALYSILTEPIKGCPWDYKPGDDSPEAKKQAEMVKEWLTKPPYEGGMSTPFDLVIADMLRAVLEGFRLFEKVRTISPDGYFVYSKIARRENTTVILKEDPRGGFDGATQYAYINGEFKKVTIAKEDCFLYTFGKEFDNLYGESAFLAGYYHYDKKHRLYYGAHQAVQYGAIPPKTVEGKENGTQEDLDNTVAAVDELGFNSTVGIPNGYKVTPYEASKGRIDPQPLIDHHNAEMARSILAQFMMLGTGESSSGSWALSKDQSDMFVLALEGVIRSLEQHITIFLTAELHEYNFENPIYGKFEFGKLTDSKITLLKEMVLKIFDKRPEVIPDYMITETLEKIATQLEIEVPKDAEPVPTKPVAGDPQNPVVNQSRQGKHFLANGASWRRELTPAEGKVNLVALSKKMDTLEGQFKTAVKPVFDKLRADTNKRLEKLLDAKDFTAISAFKLNFGSEYTSVISGQMLEAYTYAKVGAADELGVGAPATKATSKSLIKQTSQSIADKQLSDLEFAIKNIVTEAQRKNQLDKTELSVGDVLSSVAGTITGFYTSKIEPTSTIAVSKGVNMGRDDVFTAYKNKITLYQYSAILDNVTCPVCEDLDGTVVDEAEYRSTQWMPPIHSGCRCIWVAILQDEEDQPDITGFPDSPGGDTGPSLDGVPSGAIKVQPLKNFKDDNLETIAQADIAGRPNAEVNTQIEKLLASKDPAAIRDAIRLGVTLPKDDVAAMLDSITLPNGQSVGSFFYSAKLTPQGKIAKVLKDKAIDPTKLGIDEIAKIVGLPKGKAPLSREPSPADVEFAEKTIGKALDNLLEANDDDRK